MLGFDSLQLHIIKKDKNMIHTYLTLEYISIVLFGIIIVLFSIGSVYLNILKDKDER